MTIDDRNLEHEPLPTPEAARQEPQFDTRDTWQAYRREHYKWRTGLNTVDDADIPDDEGEPPAPGAADIALEVALGTLASGPGGQVGRVTTRPAAPRPSARPSSVRPTLAPKPATTVAIKSPTTGGFKNSQKLMMALSRLRNGTRIQAKDDLAGQAIANRAPRQPHTGASGPSFLESLLQQRANSSARGPGQLESVAEIQALNFEVPERVYRGHIGNTVESAARDGLQRAPGGNLQGDDYLAAIVMHTARQGGSNGEVLSLSAERAVASKFAKGRRAPVFEIDTTQDPTGFRTINDILLADSQRLVDARKVTRATVLKAIDNIAVHRESEVFYIHGDIPPRFLMP